MPAATRTNQSTSYLGEEDDDDTYDDGTYDEGTYDDGNEVNSYATHSWSSSPPRYDQVR